MSVVPVILSGGSGTRLWPLSRHQMPKQFLSLAGETSMLQATLQRIEGLSDLILPLIVCGVDHRFIVAEQLRQAGVKHRGILLEPVARNTAPALTLAALYAQQVLDADPVLLVLPADHVIKDVPGLHKAIEIARNQAEQEALVTFGIRPSEPHTGYGYIRVGHPVAGETRAFIVDEFVEKPDREHAERYLASGKYLWNSGMFMFRTSQFLKELERLRPDILEACRDALEGATIDLDFVRLDGMAFARCPEESIDYAVMEHTDRAVVVLLDAAWSDVGSWSALWATSNKDEDGNVFIGDVRSIASRGCYARSDSRLLTLVGVDDLVVVATRDAVMVAGRERTQEVKQMVDQLKKENRPEVLVHREVFRPWGKYDSIDMGSRFLVKRITVNPGACLSLQRHHHRAEHWIVVSGTAEVTCDDKVFLLGENQSTYIPLGSVHRLANPGKIPLEIIEVQSGSYLGEDDIVRLEDVYGRSEEGQT